MTNLEDLKKKRGTQVIECTGEIRNFGTDDAPQRLCSNINYTDILSALITEAGKVCKHYASDLFVSWESLLNDISKIEEKESEIVKYFGFRELGVDHEVYIQTKLAAPECYGDKPYQSVYKLVVNTRGQSITMKLTQLQV